MAPWDEFVDPAGAARIEAELLRLREIEEAAYQRLRQQDTQLQALIKELGVMKALRDPEGDGEFQLQVAAKRKLLEKEIDERTENMVALKADANNAFIKAKRVENVRSSFKDAKDRTDRIMKLRDQRRKDIGMWAVTRARRKHIVQLGEAGYGAGKRRREFYAKCQHRVTVEKGLQNALVREKTWLVNKRKSLKQELKDWPVMVMPPQVDRYLHPDAPEMRTKPLPKLEEVVRTVFFEENKLKEVQSIIKKVAKERSQWVDSHEEVAQTELQALTVSLAILEDQEGKQQAIVDHQRSELDQLRAHVAAGSVETEENKYVRLKHEHKVAVEMLKNVEIKLGETTNTIEDRFTSIGELRREQAEAVHYQETAGIKVDKLNAELERSNKWQVIAVEVREALCKERDELTHRVENDVSLTPEVCAAMREKLESMVEQITAGDQHAKDLTKRREEMETEVKMLVKRIQQSKDDVSY